ncbi:hypothetical protein D1AOALGA4SA_5987 [Olavius algarvensis Delta 1 endosymbiont]|nr:hypothetical protein D1AOALGA4SA_5987 [Olavius algarvensis Delta 1 endosymbiont]
MPPRWITFIWCLFFEIKSCLRKIYAIEWTHKRKNSHYISMIR